MGLMHGDLGDAHRPLTDDITLSLPRASLVTTLTPPLVEALLEPMVNALTQPIALEALASQLRDAVFKPLSMRLQDALRRCARICMTTYLQNFSHSCTQLLSMSSVSPSHPACELDHLCLT